MENKELYEKYLNEKLDRVVKYKVFVAYLNKYGGYDRVIEYLRKPKSTTNTRAGTFKGGNVKEIVSYAKLFSPEKAAKEYNVSERTIYRYINNQK